MRRWVPVVVLGGLLLWTALVTPLSVGIGENFAYYDPQSDPERLEHHRDLAVHVYTAGHWWGQLVAAAAGVRVARRSTAILAGALVGLLTGAVAVGAGVGAMRTHGYPGVAADPTMLTDGTVLWCLLASLLCFPLWAAAANLIRRRGLLVLAAPLSSHPLAVWLIGDAGPAALLMPAVLFAWVVLATSVS